MPLFPDFADPVLFPPFLSCPLATDPPDPHAVSYFLIGSIQENMTLTPRTPTYICRDRDGSSFAVTVKLKDGEGFETKGWKKGNLVVVRAARRSGVREENAEMGVKAKQGFVEVGRGGVGLIPMTVEKLLEMGQDWEDERKCQGCGKESEKMNRCKGCESVWYCGKECQTKGWSESHKTECKVLKAVGEVFGKE